MIIRAWRAETSSDREPDYLATVKRLVLPHLAEMPGYRGSLFMRREVPERIEYWVLTCWDSMDVVRSFAGDDPESAWVPDEIRATLDRVGETAEHFELALGHDLHRLLGTDAPPEG